MKILRRSEENSGFSLVEIAVVLVIISVLITIVAVPLATQLEQQRTVETNKQLETIKEAIIGFALARGRLPCASLLVDKGNEVVNETTGVCGAYSGFLPAVTLGISPIDSDGFAVDAWGLAQNRIRYAVMDITTNPATTPVFAECPATAVAHVLTKRDGMKSVSMSCLSKYSETTLPTPPPPRTLITVCPQTPAASAPYCAGSMLTNTAPFVVISLGKNAATGGVGTDETYNAGTAGGGLVFVSHTRAVAGAAGGEFDDLVTWTSLNTLFARMVQAGRLP